MQQDGRWIAKKMRVFDLIDQVAEAHGGDTEEDLAEFKACVLENYAEKLKVAYECFKSLVPVHTQRVSTKIECEANMERYNACCGLRKPMCKC